MTYRDDLEAAHARIAALESQVEPDELRQENAELRFEVERLRLAHEELLRENARLSERLYGRSSAKPDVARMKTLLDHNRAFPALANGSPANVLCPSCIAHGDRVEMLHLELPSDGSPVRCPRCLTSGPMRRA